MKHVIIIEMKSASRFLDASFSVSVGSSCLAAQGAQRAEQHIGLSTMLRCARNEEKIALGNAICVFDRGLFLPFWLQTQSLRL